MTGNVLKNTKCIEGCEYSKITSFCFDCPSLMCDKCNLEMHIHLKHCVTKFNNEKLLWTDRSLILELFNDNSLGELVFLEVTRNIEKYCDNIGAPEESWLCTRCTARNDKQMAKCRICSFDKKILDDLKEYVRKRDKHMEMLGVVIKAVEYCDDFQFEHVAKEYLEDDVDRRDFSSWFEQTYLVDRDLSVINEIIEQGTHQMSMPELHDQYTKMVEIKNQDLLRVLPVSMHTEEMKQSKKLIQTKCVNESNKVPQTMKEKTINETDLWSVIVQAGPYSTQQTRMIMAEMQLPSLDKVSFLYAFVNNLSFGEYLKESCPHGNVKIFHLRQALLDQVTISDAMNFLKKECNVCCGDFPMPEMQPLLTCIHEVCKSCFKEWLEETIMRKFPCKWSCPLCTDEDYKKVDRNMHYYNLRRFLEEIKSEKVLKLFDLKLLQEQLMGSKFFHWCANDECTYGFEVEGIEGKVQCRSCKSDMCIGCNRKWHEKHTDISCQEFEMWILRNDPKLSNLLNDIGIECPNCGMRYALAPGGCLHFDCKACGTQFCGGCYQLFLKTCTIPGCIIGTGFHAHHPRNCLYFLRDEFSAVLLKMLENTDFPRLAGKPEKNCPFIIADKQTMKEKACDDAVFETTGLCEIHYKEYLVQFINRFKIDPADFADSNQLNIYLFQALKPKLEKLPNESENDFIVRLKKEVKQCQFFIPKGLKEDKVEEDLEKKDGLQEEIEEKLKERLVEGVEEEVKQPNMLIGPVVGP